MSAGSYNLAVEQGATFDQTFTWKNAAGVPVDLDGYVARLHVRERAEAAVALALEQGAGLTLGGAVGTIRVLLSAATTAALTARTYVYDLELEDPQGVVTRLLAGKVTVSREVTR